MIPTYDEWKINMNRAYNSRAYNLEHDTVCYYVEIFKNGDPEYGREYKEQYDGGAKGIIARKSVRKWIMDGERPNNLDTKRRLLIEWGHIVVNKARQAGSAMFNDNIIGELTARFIAEYINERLYAHYHRLIESGNATYGWTPVTEDEVIYGA